MLQIRALVNGIPFLHSSSYVSTYLVEQRTTHTLAGEFIANLTLPSFYNSDTNITTIVDKTNHQISLQWKKLGNEIEEWRLIQPDADAIGSEQSISVLADHDHVWYLHDRKDYLLTASDVWKSVGQSITFSLERERTIVLGYCLTAQPQLSQLLNSLFINLIERIY